MVPLLARTHEKNGRKRLHFLSLACFSNDRSHNNYNDENDDKNDDDVYDDVNKDDDDSNN